MPTITQNGIYTTEFGTLCDGVEVEVNLPVYDAPAIYTTKRITSNNNYVLGDFINDNITNYTWLHKNIPVIIDVDSAQYLGYVKYGDYSYVKTDFEYTSSQTGTSLDGGKSCITIRRFTSYTKYGLISNNVGTSRNITIEQDTWYKKVNYQSGNPVLRLLNTDQTPKELANIQDNISTDGTFVYMQIRNILIDPTYFFN